MKWSAVGFAITEVVFFVLRVVLGLIPTPTVPELPKGDQPFEWNIYKTLNYFLFTIVGGLVYICILFLYVQKLSTGRDEFAQLSSFLSRGTSQAASQPNPPPSSNNNTTTSAPTSQQAQQNSSRLDNPHNKSNKPHNHSRDPERKSNKLQQQQQQPQGVEQLERKPRVPGPVNPQGVMGLNGGKEPQSPGSPMFPYFLLRRNSKLSASSKSAGQQPQQQQQPQDRMVVEEAPTTWHQPRGVQGGGGVSLLNRQEFEGQPQVGRNLLSPSMLNHHQPPLPPPHGFQPIPPPFYSDSGDERRESFVPGGFVSPTGSHYQTGYGRGQESLYQKIPMSPGFDYCLR